MEKLSEALWRIYRRPESPSPWQLHDGNLPWDDPAFSERMLREHLDESHGAASRQTPERKRIIELLWRQFGLQPGHHLLDVTCGPGLYAVEFAQRGCVVTAVDFAPAAIAYAGELAASHDVSERCTFFQQDVRRFDYGEAQFDAATLIYGQLGVFEKSEAQTLLNRICRSLKPGAQLCLELLDPEKVDKQKGNWWFTDETGLWGEAPFLHLGERLWLAEEQISVDRFYTIHLETGQLDVVELCDQIYLPEQITAMLKTAGFTAVAAHRAWADLQIYDEEEWIVYFATK